MLSESDRSTTPPSLVPSLSYATALFAWAETFVLVGLQYYWVLGKSYPLSTENWWTGVAGLMPLVVLLVVGLVACALPVRMALVRLEPWLHLTGSILLFALIALVATYDPFDMLAPFSWTLHLWAIATCFVVLADMTTLQRRSLEPAPATGEESQWSRVLATVAVGGIVLAAAATTRSLVWVWTIGLASHAFMASATTRSQVSSIVWAPLMNRILAGFSAVFEITTLALIVLAVSIQAYLAHPAVGTPELKFLGFFQLYISFGFAVGALVAVLARRFKASWAALALVAATAVWGPWGLDMLHSLLLGYALAGIAMVVLKGQNPFAYAVSAAVMTAVWFVAFVFFVFAPVADSLEPIKSIFSPIRTSCGKWILVVFAIGAVFAIAQRLLKSNGMNERETPRPGLGFCAALYAGVIALVFVPSALIVTLKSAPPMCMHRADRIAVKEPAGVCHAGYSKTDEEYAILKKLGVKAVRADFHWNAVQPSSDKWDFARFDSYVDAAAKNGVQVIAILGFDNNAVEQDPQGKERDNYIAPADIPLFEEYVRRVVEHYQGRVAAFEIWNEPSLGRFWTGTPEEFYELAKRTAETARATDPKVTIIGTAMHGPFGIWTPHQSAGLFAYDAMKQVDCPSFHMYVGDPRTYPNEFSKYDGINRTYGHPGPLCVTEIGDPDGGGYSWRATPESLAEHVIKVHVVGTSYGLGRIVWYCFQDSDTESQHKERKDSEAFFGLLAPGKQWKPAAHAYSLFNTHCCNSDIRSDILDRTGGLTARQVRTTMYRRDNGESVLILWYEPTLSGQTSVRVGLTFDELADTPVVHDIGSSYTKELLEDAVFVSERPTVITFHAKAPDARVHVAVESAVTDTLLLAMLAVGIVASIVTCVRRS